MTACPTSIANHLVIMTHHPKLHSKHWWLLLSTHQVAVTCNDTCMWRQFWWYWAKPCVPFIAGSVISPSLRAPVCPCFLWCWFMIFPWHPPSNSTPSLKVLVEHKGALVDTEMSKVSQEIMGKSKRIYESCNFTMELHSGLQHERLRWRSRFWGKMIHNESTFRMSSFRAACLLCARIWCTLVPSSGWLLRQRRTRVRRFGPKCWDTRLGNSRSVEAISFECHLSLCTVLIITMIYHHDIMIIFDISSNQ